MSLDTWMSQYNGEDPKQWSAGLIPNSSAGSWGLNHDASRSFCQARQRKLRHDGESRRKHSSQHKVSGLAGVDVLNQAAGFEEAPSLSIFFYLFILCIQKSARDCTFGDPKLSGTIPEQLLYFALCPSEGEKSPTRAVGSGSFRCTKQGRVQKQTGEPW